MLALSYKQNYKINVKLLRSMSHSISSNITEVLARIQAAKLNSNYADSSSGIVQLLAVSKTRSAKEIRQAWACGLKHYGENYLQEALAKQELLSDLPIVWHFIGPIQSNKTSQITKHFDWVHSVDRFKIAKRLNDQRPANASLLNICLQVNISQESTKSGVLLTELASLAAQINTLPRLKLRGLMCIPATSNNKQELANDFVRMKLAMEKLNSQGFELDTLSMGMSNDLECAIMEGSNMVRVGTAIFGTRD